MSKLEERAALTRRGFVRGAGAAALALSAGTVIDRSEAWGLELKGLKPETMQTLIQMARDIFPHDRLADRFYAIACKKYDDEAAADPKLVALLDEGVATLNTLAKLKHNQTYVGVGWEKDRAAILAQIEESPFFTRIHSGLVTGIYNQKEVWPLFGYEGESASKGGYVNRGFDDIAWL